MIDGSGTRSGDLHAHAGIGAVGDHRLDLGGIERD